MYCTNCGASIDDRMRFCSNCGSPVQHGRQPENPYQSPGQYSDWYAPQPAPQPAPKDDTMETVVKVFLILGCISLGWAIIPLAWCIPITVSVFNRFKRGEPISTGLKVCALLFVNLIAGICLLCMDD